ncbi:MAG TPA: hypothetical protein VFA18_19125 [Gemmataceae bacterium]|nr:hypothetical protein [Gemmataceae bacterium]
MKGTYVLAGVLVAALPAFGQSLTEKTLDSWYGYIVPKQSELTWQRIGWRPTLGEAWREARAKNKPILFWAMNGHPLGCT